MTSPTGPLVWPTTPLQRGLLALAETGTTGPGRPDPYTGQAVVRIRGPLPAGALRRAVEGLVADEPQLHAGFVVADDLDAVQFVEPGTRPRLRTVVLDDPADLDAALATTRSSDLAAGFALDDPPLVRWTHLDAGGESVLVVTAHHAVLDAWSMPLLTGQIARRLAAEVPGPHDVPAAPAARYQDHLGWLAAQDTAAATGFWERHLGHLVGTPGAPAVEGHERRRSRATVRPPGGAAWDGLTAADRARTCWGLALDAVTGRAATPFAVPVSGRDPQVPGVETAIGLFTDSVLVADPVDAATPGRTLADLTRAGADRWRASLPHHHVGTTGILRALRSPELATSLLAVEAARPPRVWRVGGTTLELQDVEDDTHYPFALTVRPGAQEWELLLDHTGDEPTARRLLHAVGAFLAADPHVPVAAVPLLSGADLDALRRSGTGPDVGAAVPPLLPHRWAEVSARCADRDLLVSAGPGGETSRQTGADLARAVDALREQVLAALPAGTPRGTRTVAVSVPRGERTVEALLAVLSAGATVLVLDPALPAARRADVLTGAGALVLVTADAVRALHDGPRGAVAVEPGPDDVAAVVLTSGSTGTPKPVAVPHRALAHLCARHSTDLHPAEPVQVAHTAAFHFDAQWDALLALFGGHTVHVLAEDLFLDPFALAGYVREHAIAYLDLTPTVWSALLAADAFGELPAVCVVGGEAFGADLWTRMRELAARTGSRVLNLYGPTEATVDAFAADVRDADVPVVGTPVGVTGAVVLDAWLRPVPPGTEGEVHLAGAQLAHGYLGLPARTAERFVANPFPTWLPGDRLYRTGDRARWDEAGRLHVAGRTDDQISLHGLRIEPGEVEHVLTDHPGISRAVVLAPQVGRGRRLVAWVVPSGGTPTAEEVRTWCAERLPAHLVPRDVLVVADLPLTPNGKLDRNALPLPGATPTSTGPEPPTGVAGVVADVVAEVLGVPVGAHEDFFALGGDSISAVRVAARLRATGWSVRPGDVLLARTPAAIATRATPGVSAPSPTGTGVPDLADLVALDPAVRAELTAHVRTAVPGSPALQAVWPLTPTQLGLHVDALRSVRDPYRTTVLLRLDDPAGRVDETAVRRAVAGLTARHPVLRTGVWQGPLREPVAFVVDRVEVPVDVVRVPGPVPDDLLEQVHRGELDRPVDAAAARLAGATWVQGGGSRTSWLVLSLHHLLVDGWSLPVLADELRRDLDGRAVAAETGGFPDHLRAVAALDREALARTWRSELAGARPTLLGGGRLADAGRVVRRGRTLTPQRSAAVRAGLRSRGASVAAVAQAAWAHVLAARTGQRDVCWALTSAGRGADVPASAVGMFVTTRTVRADTTSPTLVRDVAGATARTEEAAVLGLGGIERATGRLADTLVVVENYPSVPPAGDGVAVTLVEGRDATTFPVTATVFPGADEVRFELEVDPHLLGGDVGPELLDGWVAAVEALAAGAVPDLAVPQAPPSPEATVPRADPAGGAVPDLARRIADVATEVLGAPTGPGDDFFAAGGDSISAVHLVGALRARSIAVGIADVFAARTPRGIAAVARDVDVPAGPPAGTPVATPALAWFTDLARTADVTALRGFQQVRVVDLPAGTGAQDVAAAATELLARHEALRLRALPDPGLAAPGAAVVTAVAGAELEPALARAARAIDHTTGDLVRWVVTDPGGPGPRLAVAAHHVAVDAVSWPVLLDELRVLLAGGTLPPAPSFTAWTHAQQRAVEAAREHRAHWRRELRPCPPLTGDQADPGDLGTAGAALTREVVLDPLRSKRFLDLAAAGWRPDALLLAALTAARGQDLLVELEGHGRPTALPAGDPRQSPDAAAVGWFTATWPVRLPGRDHSRALGDHVASTARAVLASAALGPDFGLLQHLDPASADLAAAWAANRPQVLVNWLGRDVPAGAGHRPWRTSLDAAGLEDRLGLHAGLPVSHGWELNAWATTRDGEPAVVARWQVAAALRHHAGDVLDRWVADLAAVLDATAGTAPPAVHDAVGLDAADLTRLAVNTPAPQAVWPLTPVQRGMLFHAGDGPDRYTSHVELRLGGALEADRLRVALERTVAAHPQLRCHVADTASGPVLVSVADVAVPWSRHDLAVRGSLDAHRRADLEEPYDLRSGPLLRARLVRTAPDEHVLLLGSHHLLLDGWSVPALVDELLGRYAGTWREPDEDLVRGPFARATARRSGSTGSTERWRDLLAPVAADLVPALPPGFDDGTPVAAVTADLPAGALTVAALACGATPAAVVAAAWSLVLAALAGRDTVSPGVVVSGRDAGARDVLGMFVDTVPLVARCRGDVGGLVRDLAGQTLHAGAENPVGLAALAADLGRAPWTDTLLVVENYPGGGAERAAAAAGLELRDVTGRDGTHYALTLTAEDTAGAGSLRLEHHPRLLSATEAADVLAAVTDVVVRAADPSTDVTDLLPRRRFAAVRARWDAVDGPAGAGGPVEDVRAVFADLFGRPVGDDEDFFALGGDSVLAMSLVTGLRAVGWSVRPSAVFTAPTPTALAALAAPVAAAPTPRETPAAPLVDLDARATAALDSLLRNLA
ncbi:condensation domain-containing protein [Kineococcus sp. TBRC 1896]|uniref:Condensation domain-containing protein n=1 Tax=Kineococcus mangrovi TaxID=1660183 RepID=A0ABV4I438_9ACTN